MSGTIHQAMVSSSFPNASKVHTNPPIAFCRESDVKKMYPFGESDSGATGKQIQHDAYVDGIDLTVLPFAQEAIASIAALAKHAADPATFQFSNAKRIDTHTQ